MYHTQASVNVAFWLRFGVNAKYGVLEDATKTYVSYSRLVAADDDMSLHVIDVSPFVDVMLFVVSEEYSSLALQWYSSLPMPRSNAIF